jgi:hypothetical protein
MEHTKGYKIGKKMIIESDFSVKSVKTLNGMDGLIINANIYYNNKIIGHIIDDGWGGGIDVTYYTKVDGKLKRTSKNSDVDSFLSTLPNYRLGGVDEYNFDDEDLWNELIEEFLFIRDFKKSMKKIQVAHDGKIFSLVKDNKPHFLDKKYRYKGKNGISFREIIKDKYGGCVILNDISSIKAMRLFRTHCYIAGGE